MEEINIILILYKQQLAEANEQKILIQAQCELYKKEIEELRKQLKEKDDIKNN